MTDTIYAPVAQRVVERLTARYPFFQLEVKRPGRPGYPFILVSPTGRLPFASIAHLKGFVDALIGLEGAAK